MPSIQVDSDSALELDSTSSPVGVGAPYFTNRTPFSNPNSIRDDGYQPPRAKPPIPSPAAVANGTPLPKLSMVVLSIVMLGEFLSANVSIPFLMFMIKGFREWKDESEPAYWAGILVSVFFITQFVTSLLWATVADKHGRRSVIFVSLLGSALTCTIFGTSQTLSQAISTRLLQGVFGGAMGVGRSVVPLITDPSNEGRAYAVLGFCWGFGGVLGAIIGGSFESPASKWPNAFPSPIWARYPYLLPCMMASAVTFVGSILSLFLAKDGGSRSGAVALSPEKDDELFSVGKVTEVTRTISSKLSGYFLSRVPAAGTTRFTSTVPETTHDQALPHRPSSPVSDAVRFATGSAYDHHSFRDRLKVRPRLAGFSRRGSGLEALRRNKLSLGAGSPQVGSDGRDLNLAQRMLLANEFTVTNMADFWVDAAITADDEALLNYVNDHIPLGDHFEEESDEHHFRTMPYSPPLVGTSSIPNDISPAQLRTILGAQLSQRSPGSSVPSIYVNTGVKTGFSTRRDTLPTIREGRTETFAEIQQPTLMQQLPLAVILQYGLLALHSTTHDQIFLSYLVSPVESGGLGLNAAHFAQLIALMCLAQIAYQFYLYPNLGPPRGRFSHLAMFRLGSTLFLPAYLTVITYRTFVKPGEDGNIFVMCLLAVSTAIRYCGSTFAYTAVSILLNYLSPPEVNGIANGIAQSIVSFARFLGPILGGYVWSASTGSDPSGYSIGFFVVSGVTCFAIALSYFIR